MSRKNSGSRSRNHAGIPCPKSARRDSQVSEWAYPSRVLNASAPRPGTISTAARNAVAASAKQAEYRLARLRIALHANADGIASVGTTAAANRAGALQPPHHMAKFATVSRYGTMTKRSSIARRRDEPVSAGCCPAAGERPNNINPIPATAITSTGAFVRRPNR